MTAILPAEKRDRISGRSAAEALARMMERKMLMRDGSIDEMMLRTFLKENWNRVSILAHAIHEDAP